MGEATPASVAAHRRSRRIPSRPPSREDDSHPPRTRMMILVDVAPRQELRRRWKQIRSSQQSDELNRYNISDMTSAAANCNAVSSTQETGLYESVIESYFASWRFRLQLSIHCAQRWW